MLSNALFLSIQPKWIPALQRKVLLLLLLLSPLYGLSQNPLQPGEFVPGAFVLKVKPQYRAQCQLKSIEIPELEQIFLEANALDISKSFPFAQPPSEQTNSLGQSLVDLSLIYNVQFDPSVNPAEILSLFENQPYLTYVEVRYQYELFYEPNDPSRFNQWYLDTLGAFAAWDISKGDSSVVIGIVDTGTSFPHADLDSSVAYNPLEPIDGIDNDLDGYVDNYRGWDFGGVSFSSPGDNNPNFVGSGPGKDHGVLTSGIAAAESDNQKGMASIGFNCSYLPLKGSIDNSTGISYGYEALVYAADHGVPIINLSWGSTFNSQYGEDAVNYAVVNKGALVVAAAGNRHLDLRYYPASFDRVMSVGGTQVADAIWISNANTGSSYNYLVDICAPARSIFTTAGNTGYWGGATGTSMAAPMVCGAAGLLKSWNPTLNNQQIGELLRVSAKDVYPLNPAYEDKMGKGRLSLPGAFNTALKSLRIDTLAIKDNENELFEATDTLYLYPHLINYLAPLQNPIVKVSAADPTYIEVIDSLWSPGSMGTLAHSRPQTPLRIKVKGDLSVFKNVYLRFEFTDGGYHDFQYWSLPIQPAWLDVTHNAVWSTLPGDGRLGFIDEITNSYGNGLRNYLKQTLVSNLSFMNGSSSTDLLETYRKSDGDASRDFKMVDKPREGMSAFSDGWEAQAKFSSPDGLRQYKQKVYAFSSQADSNYILVEYEIKNNGLDTLNDQYAGMGVEWSSFGPQFRGSTYDSQNQSLYNRFFNGMSNEVGGIAILSDLPIHYFAEDTSDFDYSKVSKFFALSSGLQQRHTGGEAPLQFLAAGPFTLAPGESQRLAFALIIENNATSFASAQEQAKSTYYCRIRQELPLSELDSLAFLCPGQDSIDLQASQNLSQTYLWNTGSNSPTLRVGSPGDYFVEITNNYGCNLRDSIRVTRSSLSAAINHQIATPGSTTIDFQSNAGGPGNLDWFWDFGDGQFSTLPNPNHTYAVRDSYLVKLQVSDQQCSVEDQEWIYFSPLTGLQTSALLDGLNVWPIPAANHLNLGWENDFRGDIQLELFDLQGKRLFEKRIQKNTESLSFQLTTHKFSRGSYILKLSTAQNQFLRRIVLH